jgi:hypothetical protein
MLDIRPTQGTQAGCREGPLAGQPHVFARKLPVTKKQEAGSTESISTSSRVIRLVIFVTELFPRGKLVSSGEEAERPRYFVIGGEKPHATAKQPFTTPGRHRPQSPVRHIERP